MASADWMVRWAEGLEPSPRNLTLRNLLGGGGDTGSRSFRFHIPQYLTRRAKDWADRGFKETLVDWPSLNARSKFWGDDQRASVQELGGHDEPVQAAQRHCREHPAPGAACGGS